jgi:predicted dehydrogenase
MKMKRNEFLYSAALTAGMVPLAGSAVPIPGERRNMCGHGAAPVERIRIGIIGLGSRGKGAIRRLVKIRDVEIAALCDLREEMVVRSQKLLTDAGRPPARSFSGTEEIWKDLAALDLDLIYIVTPWRWHAPMAVYSMKQGKHTATEVPAAVTLDECWELVETSEKTGRHCMMLENCCYDFFELQTLNMVRQGVFGELTHAEGAYIHALSELIANEVDGYQGMWRFKQNRMNNGNLYPTHGLGPIAQCLDINRGNRFSHLVSMSSQEAAFTAWAKQAGREKYAALEQYRGDMNTTLIKCAGGQTVMIQHDVSTPRPYSRIHLIQGSKGAARKWPDERIALGHTWQTEEFHHAAEYRLRGEGRPHGGGAGLHPRCMESQRPAGDRGCGPGPAPCRRHAVGAAVSPDPALGRAARMRYGQGRQSLKQADQAAWPDNLRVQDLLTPRGESAIFPI